MPRQYQWDTVDWSLTDGEIAALLETRPGLVWTARKRLGKPKTPARPPIDWSAVDWGMPAAQLAAQLGCSVNQVHWARNKAGAAPSGKRAVIEWDAVDWSRPTSEIAAELMVAAATVSLKRQKRAKRKYNKILRGHNWDEIDWHKSNRQIAEELALTPAYVSRKRRLALLKLTEFNGEALRRFRVAKSMPQSRVAEMLNVRLDLVRRWENGSVTPSGPSALKLCLIFNVPASAFLK